MKIEGKLVKAGAYWHVEVPILDVVTQGTSRPDAYRMIKDAIEVIADEEGFEVEIYPGDGDTFTVEANDTRTMLSLMLKRQRIARGLTLENMAKALNINSVNAYARYEQGKNDPTIGKLEELLEALGGEDKSRPAPTFMFAMRGSRRATFAKAKPGSRRRK